jgi:hypothetical protein
MQGAISQLLLLISSVPVLLPRRFFIFLVPPTRVFISLTQLPTRSSAFQPQQPPLLISIALTLPHTQSSISLAQPPILFVNVRILPKRYAISQTPPKPPAQVLAAHILQLLTLSEFALPPLLPLGVFFPLLHPYCCLSCCFCGNEPVPREPILAPPRTLPEVFATRPLPALASIFQQPLLSDALAPKLHT